MKGKPWPSEDEKKLKDWFKSGITDFGILSSNFDGKYSSQGIRQKLMSLRLFKEQQQVRTVSCCSSHLVLPKELRVEEALKTLSAALKVLEQSALDKGEVLRLRSIISGIKIYKELLVDYMDYRGREVELLDLREKFVAYLPFSAQKLGWNESFSQASSLIRIWASFMKIIGIHNLSR